MTTKHLFIVKGKNGKTQSAMLPVNSEGSLTPKGFNQGRELVGSSFDAIINLTAAVRIDIRREQLIELLA
jgi:hypothetical protein